METDRTRMSRIEELQMKEHGHVAEVPLIVHYTSVVAFLVNVLQLLTSSTTLERREKKGTNRFKIVLFFNIRFTFESSKKILCFLVYYQNGINLIFLYHSFFSYFK